MTAAADDDEEFTELVGATSAAWTSWGGPRTASPVSCDKQDESAGLLDAGFVRDLIAKADPSPNRRRW